MTDTTRIQGWLICSAAIVLGVIFLVGILRGSYWALAIPVAVAVAFVLGLTFWVGFTIATIRVEPEEPGEAADSEPQAEAGTDAPPRPPA